METTPSSETSSSTFARKDCGTLIFNCALLFSLAIVMSACATRWHNDQPRDLQQDAMRCETLAWQVVGSDGGFVRDGQRENYRNQCLRSLGWYPE